MGFHQKYAPQSADEIVGQTTAVNVALNHTRNFAQGARPYLSMIFAGPPGVGKTTLASTISAQIQCGNLNGNRPCGVCQSCLNSRIRPNPYWRKIDCGECSLRDLNDAFDDVYNYTIGTAFVLFCDEIGDADRDKKNEIRSRLDAIDRLFQENLGLPLAERHSLTQRKPVFIFATTEDKVRSLDSSLVSRSKEITFVPIAPRFIHRQLSMIGRAESIDISDDVLWTIAMHSGGDLRKAIGQLEELASLGRPITAIEANEVLGFADEMTFLEILLAMKMSDDLLADLFANLEMLAPPTEIVKGLTNAVYHLFAHARGQTRAGAISDNLHARYNHAADVYSLNELCYIIDVVRRPGFQQAIRCELIEASLYEMRHHLMNKTQEIWRIEPRLQLHRGRPKKSRGWII
ncbi:MAG: AAA family ATPase [Spirochaetota bacterium]